jgi:hypothetical protein
MPTRAVAVDVPFDIRLTARRAARLTLRATAVDTTDAAWHRSACR